MKYSSIYLYLIVLFIESASTWPTIVEKSLTRLNPRGYSISVTIDVDNPAFTSMNFVQIHANAEKAIENPLEVDFFATLTQPTDDYWVFSNVNEDVKPGSLIVFKITMNANYKGPHLIDKRSYDLGEFYMRLSSSNSSDIQPLSKEMCDAFAAKCGFTETTVGGKSVCNGDLIFEDNFDTLDTINKWKHVVRIPNDDKDSFASFQKRSENCYVEDGKLHIIPTLLSDVPGYDESTIRTGNLKLKDCTPLYDESRECQRQAYSSQILPPIVSAKIQTKDSFSFRYGRIEIRAKLPRGDWLFPLMVLNPLENLYGYLSSGQIYVAFTRGNDMLFDSNRRMISRETIFGGPVMSDKQYLHTKPFEYPFGSHDFSDHTYTLIWKPDYIASEIDGIEYARVVLSKEPYKFRKLFEREFFLTLGVSVGGHVQFPDGRRNGGRMLEKPWTNSDPKAMLNFWKDRGNWRMTWNGNDVGLHIDYIRVYAL